MKVPCSNCSDLDQQAWDGTQQPALSQEICAPREHTPSEAFSQATESQGTTQPCQKV